MTNPNRTPAGVPTGGQFAASARAESSLSLAEEAAIVVSGQDSAVGYMEFMDAQFADMPEPESGCCSECGNLWAQDPNGSPGVVVHWDEDTNGPDYDADSHHTAVPEENVETLPVAASATDWTAGTVTVDVPDGPPQTWHTVDSDDRYPGQFASQVGERDGFRLRIDPGNHSTYAADGFAWSATGPDGAWNFSGLSATRDEAAREAAASADYVTSGRAEHDYYTDEYAGETG